MGAEKTVRIWGWGQDLRGRGGNGDKVCGDGVGDSVVGTGWRWGRTAVPVQLALIDMQRLIAPMATLETHSDSSLAASARKLTYLQNRFTTEIQES